MLHTRATTAAVEAAVADGIDGGDMAPAAKKPRMDLSGCSASAKAARKKEQCNEWHRKRRADEKAERKAAQERQAQTQAAAAETRHPAAPDGEDDGSANQPDDEVNLGGATGQTETPDSRARGGADNNDIVLNDAARQPAVCDTDAHRTTQNEGADCSSRQAEEAQRAAAADDGRHKDTAIANAPPIAENRSTVSNRTRDSLLVQSKTNRAEQGKMVARIKEALGKIKQLNAQESELKLEMANAPWDEAEKVLASGGFPTFSPTASADRESQLAPKILENKAMKDKALAGIKKDVDTLTQLCTELGKLKSEAAHAAGREALQNLSAQLRLVTSPSAGASNSTPPAADAPTSTPRPSQTSAESQAYCNLDSGIVVANAGTTSSTSSRARLGAANEVSNVGNDLQQAQSAASDTSMADIAATSSEHGTQGPERSLKHMNECMDGILKNRRQ